MTGVFEVPSDVDLKKALEKFNKNAKASEAFWGMGRGTRKLKVRDGERVNIAAPYMVPKRDRAAREDAIHQAIRDQKRAILEIPYVRGLRRRGNELFLTMAPPYMVRTPRQQLTDASRVYKYPEQYEITWRLELDAAYLGPAAGATLLRQFQGDLVAFRPYPVVQNYDHMDFALRGLLSPRPNMIWYSEYGAGLSGHIYTGGGGALGRRLISREILESTKKTVEYLRETDPDMIKRWVEASNGNVEIAQKKLEQMLSQDAKSAFDRLDRAWLNREGWTWCFDPVLKTQLTECYLLGDFVGFVTILKRITSRTRYEIPAELKQIGTVASLRKEGIIIT